MKPFDDQLADNVRKTFDAYSEEVAPRAWEDMQARLERGGKSRVVPLWPFLAKAAGVALLTGLSIFWYTKFQPVQTGEGLADQATETSISGPETDTDFETPAVVAETISPAVFAEAPPPARRQTSVVQPGQSLPGQEEALALIGEGNRDTLPALLAEVQLADAEIEAEHPSEETELREVPTLALRPERERQGAQNGQQGFGPSPERETGQGGDKEPRLSWGVSAGSMLAFAERHVSDGPGYAAGLIAEYAISPNITLASGGSLTYHNFELVNFSQSDFMYDYVGENLSAGDVSLTGNNEYEMLALEIPLNAQFNVMETGRGRLYVSTGLSSLVYLQQRLSGTKTAFVEQAFYNDATGQMEMQFTTSTFNVNEEYGALSRFDFGRLLNLSLGYVILRRNSAVVIEPFVKLPMGTLTSRDISLGMGGISLKYRFSGH